MAEQGRARWATWAAAAVGIVIVIYGWRDSRSPVARIPRPVVEPRALAPQHDPPFERTLGRIEESFRDVYLQLLSIIQGVAFGYLASVVSTNFDRFTASQWLRVAAAFLAILATWQEYMVGATAFAWVPTVLDSLIPFALGGMEFALITVVSASFDWYLATLAVAWATGSIAYINSVYHIRRGFPINEPSYALIGGYVRFGRMTCLVATAATTLLWLSYRFLGTRGTRNDLMYGVLSLLPLITLVMHMVWHWNGPIRAYRRRSHHQRAADH